MIKIIVSCSHTHVMYVYTQYIPVLESAFIFTFRFSAVRGEHTKSLKSISKSKVTK